MHGPIGSREYSACLESMLKLLAPWNTNCELYGKEDWFTEEFTRSLNDLDPDATTGLGPMSLYGSDVRQALGYDPIDGYDPDRTAIFKQHVADRLENPDKPDPILVFVKPEPHSRAKALDKRWRIISAVGLIDTMTDRVMLGWLQRAVLTTVGKTPALIGWSPYRGGYRFLSKRYLETDALCIDKSTWDWTTQGWMLIMVRDIIHQLAKLAPPEWHQWLNRRWEALFRDAVFGFRTGERIQQSGWGVMKSGCYLTIVINSICQMILHDLACARLDLEPQWKLFSCVGDDTVQAAPDNVQQYLAELANLGAIIKEHTVGRVIEFCGHTIYKMKCVPAYKSKHVFKLQRTPTDKLPEILQAYQWAYCMDDEMWDWTSKWLARVSPARLRPRYEAYRLVVG